MTNKPLMMIELANAKGIAFIDAEDWPKVQGYSWRLNSDGYALAYQGGGMVWMHRLVMDAPNGMDVDHKDHDRLWNLRSNLRICTRSQNLQNARPRKGCASRFKGVSWHRGARRWRAGIRVEGKNRHLGLFDTEEEAARAYDDAAEKAFGEFAFTNRSATSSSSHPRD